MYKDVSSFTSYSFGISLACEPFLICLPMKSHLRFVILPFFTLCRIHCLSICLKLNVMSVVWINFYECEVCMGIKKERSNIINHCVCIRMSGYWLIIFNFVIFSLITQWFFSARLEDEKCSSKWNQNTILVWQEEDYWIEIKMLKAIDDDNINLSFFPWNLSFFGATNC